MGDIISGKNILEEIKKVGILAAIATSERNMKRWQDFGIPAFVVSEINNPEIVNKLEQLKIDLLVNFNSSIIFSQNVLSCLKIGGINFHPGILPNYAGSNVHQWMMLNGELWGGVTIHVIEQRVDQGSILCSSKTQILDTETGLTLFMKLIQRGRDLIVELLPEIARNGFSSSRPQDLSNWNFFSQSKKPNGKINFAQNASKVRRFIQALNYRPTISPLGCSFVDAPLGPIEPITVSVSQALQPSGIKPGTIIKIDSEHVSIACKDKSLLIEKFWLNGRAMGTEEAAVLAGMHVGQII